MPVIKCAVYVRKSTEHGLEQAFNSLDNQEQSCKAYISSQAFNNWEYTKTYSDGGIFAAQEIRKAQAVQSMVEFCCKYNIIMRI